MGARGGGWNWRDDRGEKAARSESRSRKDEDRMRGRDRRDGTKGWPDSIVGVAPTTKYHRLVIPDPTYADSGVQPSADNRTGYVVDLAGNIYELLLPLILLPTSVLFHFLVLSFSRSLAFIHSLSLIHLFTLLISSSNAHRYNTCCGISTFPSWRASAIHFHVIVYSERISECNSLGRPSYLFTAVVEPVHTRARIGFGFTEVTRNSISF